jgi:hypothetical protein
LHVDHMPMRVSLFCARRERQRRSRAAEKRDEMARERKQVVGEITPSRTWSAEGLELPGPRFVWSLKLWGVEHQPVHVFAVQRRGVGTGASLIR